jgi:CBS domain-containing protein
MQMNDTTTAKDIMTTHLITIREGDSIEEALKVLVNHRVTGLPVVDAKGTMVGVISEYDIIRQLSSHKKIQAQMFREKAEYSNKPFGLPESTPLADVVKHFIDSKFRRIPIVDAKGKLTGIITRRDLMKVYFYRATVT